MGSASYGTAHLPQTRSDGATFAAPSHPALSMLGLLGLLFELALDRVALVARLDLLAVAPVLLRVRLGVLHQSLDLVLGEAARRRDGDVLLAAGRLVARLDVHDAVRIDVERHLDLRDPAGCGRDAI